MQLQFKYQGEISNMLLNREDSISMPEAGSDIKTTAKFNAATGHGRLQSIGSQRVGRD